MSYFHSPPQVSLKQYTGQDAKLDISNIRRRDWEDVESCSDRLELLGGHWFISSGFHCHLGNRKL